MAEERRFLHCRRCGSPAQAGDRFCGVCGAEIAHDAKDAASTERAPTQVSSAPSVPIKDGNGTLLVRVVVGALLILLLAGAGMVVLGIFGIDGVLHPTSRSPDSAFDPLLPTLQKRTTAPIMLPAELPKELKNVAVDEDLEGDRYRILFETGPPDDPTIPFVRAATVATLTAVPKWQVEPNKLFEATSTEGLRLPDGTEARLSRMEPVREVVNYGPYWEGTFDEGGYTYTLSTFLGRGAKGVSERALSSMVTVE